MYVGGCAETVAAAASRSLRFRRMMNQITNAIMAMRATPPMTPPTMAPMGGPDEVLVVAAAVVEEEAGLVVAEPTVGFAPAAPVDDVAAPDDTPDDVVFEVVVEEVVLDELDLPSEAGAVLSVTVTTRVANFRPSVSPLQVVYIDCQEEMVTLSQK